MSDFFDKLNFFYNLSIHKLVTNEIIGKEVEFIMKKGLVYLALSGLILCLFCCTSENKEEYTALAKINDYTLSLEEFQNQLAAEIEFDKDFKLTKEAKKRFLEELIRKELLIQESKRFNLDKKEKFVRAIERYWEYTLIRDLMDMKGKEISKKILISQEEIEASYRERKKSDDNLPPISKLQDKISEDLRERKKTRMVKEWINDLKEKAKIQINEKLLYKD